MIDLSKPLSVRADNALYQLGLRFETPQNIRSRLIATARGEPYVYNWLLGHVKGCGKLTAAELCRVFGLPTPRRKRHCPTCTCGQP